MNQPIKSPEYNFVVTTEFPCQYSEGKLKRVQLAAQTNASEAINDLASSGFNRHGSHVTKGFCRSCRACKASRIRVADSVLSKTQRKVARRNSGLSVEIVAADFYPEHFELYKKYHLARHPNGDMARDGVDEYRRFIRGYAGALLAVFRSHEGAIVLVSLFEAINNALVAHHSWYEPTARTQSLGIYNILWLLETARKTDREFVYTGEWLGDNRKLSYKSNFAGAEVLLDREWVSNPTI